MSPQNQGGWQPLPPSGDYDPEATGFLQLPPEGWDAEPPAGSPLAAPGHGFTPPPIAPAAADPAETGAFRIPDFSTPPDAEHTGTWQVATGEARHPADGEASRTEGQISAWTKVTGSEAPATEGAAMRRGLSAAQGSAPRPPGEQETAEWPAPFAPGGQASAPEEWTVSGDGTGGGQWPAPVAAEDESGEYTLGRGDVLAPDTVAEEAPAEHPVPAEHSAPAEHAAADDLSDEHPRTSYVLRINDDDRPVTDAWIGESLLYVLRERLGLAGAKDGCSQGECGACNVKVDGRLVASCLVPAATAAGAEIRTSEGLAKDGLPSDVQRALAASGAVQCGFCIPGLAMTVHDLLEGNHTPNERETRQALCGNLCRCTGYQGVLSAVQDVIAQRTGPHDEAAAHIPQQAGPGEGSVAAPPHMPPPRRPGEQEGGPA